MSKREWSEDDPLNGPRCLTSALAWCILLAIAILTVARIAHCAEPPDAPSTHKHQPGVVPIETYPPDQRMIVHNWPDRAQVRAAPRILDWSFILGHGVYAGALAFDSWETARYVGGCAMEGNPDLGSDPGNRRLIAHGLVELGAVVAGDALLKWIGRRNRVPRWMGDSLGLMAASVGTGKHLKGGMDWVRLCQ